MKRERCAPSKSCRTTLVPISFVLCILGAAGCAGSSVKADPPLQQSETPVVSTPVKGTQPVAPAVSSGPSGILACTFREETMSEAARILINEGIALHDRGDYAGAAHKYQEVLAQDPENLLALYELSSTEVNWGHDKEAVEHAGAGTRCRSPYRTAFYLALGSALDNLSNPGAAIASFEEGLRQSPPPEAENSGNRQMLHYNLALTLLRQRRLDEAQRHAETAALLRPEHSSPYLVLGLTHTRLGNRIPALYALLRFLCLEPTTPRAKEAAGTILQLFDLGVERDKGIIKIDPSAPTSSEGDFAGVTMFLGLVTAAGAGKPEIETRKQQITVLAGLSANSAAGKQSFSRQHNAPFLAALEKQQLIEPLAQVLMAVVGDDAARAWVRGNTARVVALVNFAKNAKE